MRPLQAVVAICLVLSISAHPENIEDVKELPQSKEPVVEAEESEPQARKERCTTCTGSVKLGFKPNDVLAALQAIPGAEIHTQSSYESCTSDKGCAGLKVKDGRVIEKFGNVDAFKAAAAADSGNEFTFHAGGALGNVFEGGIPDGGPFWWMNQNSPFKAGAAGGNFEKFSKSSSSFTSSGSGAAGAAPLLGGAVVDIAANPFLNGAFAAGADGKPQVQSSSFESSSFSTSSKGDVDLTKNPFLNGGIKFGQTGFAAQGGFGAGGAQFGAGATGAGAQSGQGSGQFGASQSQSAFSAASNNAFGAQGNQGFNAGAGNSGSSGSGQGAFGGQFSGASYNAASKFGSAGYTGSSPSPFTASTAGSNVNLIQNSQKASEFDFEQQQQTQQNIDEAFQSTGNVHAHEHSGGELQQTCSGQGYVCVHKAQCNNGVVNMNGAGVLQARTQKQYCNTKTEICCRIEVPALSGAGSLQGSLGVGSATFQGSGSQGSGLFVSGQASQAGQSAQSGQSGQGFGAGQSGSAFGQGTTAFNAQGQGTTAFNAQGQGQSSFESSRGQSAFESGRGQSAFESGQSGRGQSAFESGQSGRGQSAFESGRGQSASESGRGQSGFDSRGQGAFERGRGTQSTFESRGQSTFESGRGTAFDSRGQSAFGAGRDQGTFGSGRDQGAFGTGQTTFRETQTSTTFGANNFGSSNGGNRGTFGQGTQTNQGAGAFEGSATFGAGQGGSGTGSFGSNTGSSSFGAQGTQTSSTFGSNTNTNTNRGTGFESGFGTNKFGASGTFGTGFSTVAPATSGNRFGTNNQVFKTSQTNFVETDSFSAGSEVAGVFRPGAGPGLKPGLPYLPPVDSVNQPTIISSTAVPAIVTTQRPFTTVRPTTPKPYLPPVPSTNAPGYLPPVQGDSSNYNPSVVNPPRPPTYTEGGILLDQNRQPAINNPATPAGCAAALKCTPIEFCTAEGVISNTTVVLTRDQEAYRVPLTDCKDLQSGQIGKCCRDPLYTDPWPTNQLGKWVPGVFGGNDGKYVPDSKGSGSNNPRLTVTARPDQTRPVTGGVLLNNYRPKPTTPTFGPNQVTPGFPSSTVSTTSFGQKGQFEVRRQGQAGQGSVTQFSQGGQGQYSQGGQGQFSQGGQGQFSQGGQGQFGIGSQGQIGIQQGGATQTAQGTQFTSNTQTFGQKGQGQVVSQGQGSYVEQGEGGFGVGGRGQYAVGGQGQLEIGGGGAQGQFTQVQGQKTFGQTFSQGQGQNSQGFGVVRGQGQAVSQGAGFGVTQGQGQAVSQGAGFGISVGQGGSESGFGISGGFGTGLVQGQGQGVRQGFGSGLSQGFGQAIVAGEGQTSASEVYRVFLTQYGGSGQCGVLNGQKPYGNRNDLEVDFAEIPWQAMVLLQTNRSLLCGGVITRPDVVLTSASCVEGLEAKNVLIKGGEWKLGVDDEPLPFQIVQVKTIIKHPFYKSGSLKNDAAILVLTENLRLAKNIYPICLPRAEETLDAFYNGAGECIVTGWGKQVLQAHLSGSIMHSVNISLLNPGECQAKLSSDYPHLLEQYEQESCACGQPLNPNNNVCKVDIGSALACTTDNTHYVLRGLYSWDSGCQTGNQLAAFYKFDLEWYEWAIGLIESTRFAKFAIGSKITQNRFSSQIKGSTTQFSGSSQYSGVKGAVKGSAGAVKGFKGTGIQESGARFQGSTATATATTGSGFQGGFGAGQFQGSGAAQEFGSGQFGFSQFGSSSKFSEGAAGTGSFGAEIKGPISNTFSATYSEKKVFQTEPKIITYTTKPEIVTFTTKPEYFTFTTKPKLVTYTTKPQIITYETSGSGTNPQYVAPGVTFNPSFGEVAGLHKHNAQCKCLEKGKK
ncbi:hypothetical protein ABMA28_011611 [Loxostege sticticalis]|uniref:Peptidase S1 domain-containing protein n=1 Tax=Loxostege sticticalis TaxID=481309 RepID=A0ABD0S9M1_LOXSC